MILQTTLFEYISIWGVKPNLMLIIPVFFGLRDGQMTGAIIGFICGLIEDSFSSGPRGVNALSKTLLGFSVGSLKGGILRDSLTSRAIVIFLATFLNEIFLFMIFFILDLTDSFLKSFKSVIIISAFYNTALGLFFFYFSIHPLSSPLGEIFLEILTNPQKRPVRLLRLKLLHHS